MWNKLIKFQQLLCWIIFTILHFWVHLSCKIENSSLCKTEVLCHDSYLSSKYAQTSWDYLNFCLIFIFLFSLLCFPKILLLQIFFFFLNTMKICDLILKITFKLKNVALLLELFLFSLFIHIGWCVRYVNQNLLVFHRQRASVPPKKKRNNTQIKMIYNHACSNNCSKVLIQILIHALMNQLITDYIQYYIRTISHRNLYKLKKKKPSFAEECD